MMPSGARTSAMVDLWEMAQARLNVRIGSEAEIPFSRSPRPLFTR